VSTVNDPNLVLHVLKYIFSQPEIVHFTAFLLLPEIESEKYTIKLPEKRHLAIVFQAYEHPDSDNGDKAKYLIGVDFAN